MTGGFPAWCGSGIVAGFRLAEHNGIVTYRMYSPAGDEAVADLVVRAWLVISAGLHHDAAQAWIREHRDKVERTHGEIRDTVVRQEIAAALGPDWHAAYGCKFDEWLGVTPEPIAVNGPFEP